MAEEKDFCTYLTEQIIDERNAQKAYHHLLDLFEEEKELLTSGQPEMKTVAKMNFEIIGDDEEKHRIILENFRKALCETKE